MRHGPMWSDKTTWLIEKMAGSLSLAFKPNIDNRYTEKAVLRSHTGTEAEAILVDRNKPKQLWDKVKSARVDRIVIDETNFLTTD